MLRGQIGPDGKVVLAGKVKIEDEMKGVVETILRAGTILAKLAVLKMGKPRVDREALFDNESRMRFDVSLPELMIAFEVQGGIFPMKSRDGRRGAHGSVTGILATMRKMNRAQELGWKVYQYVPDEVRDDRTLHHVHRVIARELDDMIDDAQN